MTAALATLVVLFVIAAAVAYPALGVMQQILRGVMGLAAFAYRVVSLMFVIGGYVVALILWGLWLCIDRRGALEAYRAYPNSVGFQD